MKYSCEAVQSFFFQSSLSFLLPLLLILHVDLTFFSINYHAQEVFQGEEEPSG